MPACDARSTDLHEGLDMSVPATMKATRGKEENGTSSFAVIMHVPSTVSPMSMSFIHAEMQAGNVHTLQLAERRVNETKKDTTIKVQMRKSLAPSFANYRASTDVQDRVHSSVTNSTRDRVMTKTMVCKPAMEPRAKKSNGGSRRQMFRDFTEIANPFGCQPGCLMCREAILRVASASNDFRETMLVQLISGTCIMEVPVSHNFLMEKGLLFSMWPSDVEEMTNHTMPVQV